MAEIDEQINNLAERINNLEAQENAYKVLRQNFNAIRNQQIPISKVQWDTAPLRTLKQVLGNLDNMPYSNLREWLEHMAIRENDENPTTSSNVIWQQIPIN